MWTCSYPNGNFWALQYKSSCAFLKGMYGVAQFGFYQTSRVHYGDVIMGAIASQITSLTIVSSIFYSDADQRKDESSASLAFAGNSPWSSWPGCDRSRTVMTIRQMYYHSATGRTKVHYTKGEILRKSSFLQLHYADHAIMSQLCTCHDSSAVVTCAKLWIDIILLSGLLQRNT